MIDKYKFLKNFWKRKTKNVHLGFKLGTYIQMKLNTYPLSKYGYTKIS